MDRAARTSVASLFSYCNIDDLIDTIAGASRFRPAIWKGVVSTFSLRKD
jgi:hypothetical protein